MSTRRTKALEKAREYLLNHMDEPRSLTELAYETGMSLSKLKNDFKQHFGTTVFGMLREERMQKAKRLLDETDLSVKRISGMVGYKNPSNFSEAFKKRFGYPPIAVRRRA